MPTDNTSMDDKIDAATEQFSRLAANGAHQHDEVPNINGSRAFLENGVPLPTERMHQNIDKLPFLTSGADLNTDNGEYERLSRDAAWDARQTQSDAEFEQMCQNGCRPDGPPLPEGFLRQYYARRANMYTQAVATNDEHNKRQAARETAQGMARQMVPYSPYQRQQPTGPPPPKHISYDQLAAVYGSHDPFLPTLITQPSQSEQTLQPSFFASRQGPGPYPSFAQLASDAYRQTHPVPSAEEVERQRVERNARYTARENVRKAKTVSSRLAAHKEHKHQYEDKVLRAIETPERLRLRQHHFNDLFADAKRPQPLQQPTDPNTTTSPPTPMPSDPSAGPYSKARHLTAIEDVLQAEESLRAARLRQKPRAVGRKTVRRAQMAAGLDIPTWKAENRGRRERERVEESKRDPMDALTRRMQSSLRLAKAKAKTGRKGGLGGKGRGRRRLNVTDVRGPRVGEDFMARGGGERDEGEMPDEGVGLGGSGFDGQGEMFMSGGLEGQFKSWNGGQATMDYGAMGGWQQGDGGVKLEADDGDMEIE